MSATHEKLPKLFWVQLLLVAIVAALYFYYSGSIKKHGETTEQANPKAQAAADNLKPVGKITLTENTKSAASKKVRTGKQVYDAACFACHTTGVANAPKPDDNAAWQPRVAQGLDTLIKTAINGKGAMPPRGGNPSISDEEIKAAILFMTTKAGFDLASAANNKNDITNATTTQVEITSTDVKPVSVSQETTQTTPSSVKAPQPVAAPVPPKPPTTPSEPVMEKVATITTPADVTATAAPGNNASLKVGEKIYKRTCFACHATGVANAPKLEDKANWAPRIASGIETLYHSALNGKGVMPPKGGNMGLADDDVKAAVDYMVSQAQ